MNIFIMSGILLSASSAKSNISEESFPDLIKRQPLSYPFFISCPFLYGSVEKTLHNLANRCESRSKWARFASHDDSYKSLWLAARAGATTCSVARSYCEKSSLRVVGCLSRCKGKDKCAWCFFLIREINYYWLKPIVVDLLLDYFLLISYGISLQENLSL